MLGKWSNPESPDLIFKGAFERFQSEWFERFGWYLFLPLTNSDLHCFNTLHCLTKNEQSEFDSQVLSLVKITIDSINVKGVKAVMPCDESGSIKLFSAFLKSKGINFIACPSCSRQNFDVVGHYSRPDVTKLHVNRDRQSTVEFD